jgi:hypothetical protein
MSEQRSVLTEVKLANFVGVLKRRFSDYVVANY